MAVDARFRGPKGDTGPIGPIGPQGIPGTPAEIDHDALAKAIMAKFPAFTLQYLDKAGQVVEEVPFQFDPATNRMAAKINPIPVETFDAAGKLKDSEFFPLTWAIKLKPIIIPATKGT